VSTPASRDVSEAAIFGLACNPALPQRLAPALAALGDEAVIAELTDRGLIINRNRPCSATSADADTDFSDTAIDVLRDPDTAVETVAAAADSPDPSDRAVAAGRPGMVPEILQRLADDPAMFVRVEIAGNPTTPTPILRTLANDRDAPVRRAVALNPAVPLEVLFALAPRLRLNLRGGVPRIEAATQAELRRLARSRTAQVRALAASRSDLTNDLRKLLLTDSDAGVVKLLAGHPDVDADDLRLLVARSGPRVYSAVARNSNCPPELLHTMARNARLAEKCLREIARHRSAEPRTLLLCLENHRARPIAAAHPHLPPHVLRGLVYDERASVACNAAGNPSLPVEAMQELLASAQPRT
jgi:hypothetical protein